MTSLTCPRSLPRPVAIGSGTHGPGRCAYRLHGLWQLHLYPYAAEALIGDRRLAIRPGTAGLTPPGAEMRYDLGFQGTHLFAHFALAPGEVPLCDAPTLIHLGGEFPRLERALGEARAWRITDPTRAAVRLWDVLGSVIAAAPTAPEGGLAVRARSLIEALLPGPVTIAGLARELGCSREHLARTFRRDVGTTLVAYVRQRRVARAEHLLTTSTRAVQDIARQVGVADLHAFNKLIRRELGQAPRQVRAAAQRPGRRSLAPPGLPATIHRP